MAIYADLMRHARYPDDLRTLAFAGVIASGIAEHREPLIRGMSETAFRQLLLGCFPGIELDNGATATDPFDEFDDLLELLLEYRVEKSEINDYLARAIATAAMADDHLWQDMGLPERRVLLNLLREFFPALAARNVGDMRWKKFFYRQLCERTGVVVCKAPHCAVCNDYQVCFGAEEGVAKIFQAPQNATA